MKIVDAIKEFEFEHHVRGLSKKYIDLCQWRLMSWKMFTIDELFIDDVTKVQEKHIKQVIHRQKLAKMFLKNQWYEKKQVQSSSFFEDIPNGKAKEKISYFPKMYYRLEKGLFHIQVEITLGKYQDQLLTLEN